MSKQFSNSQATKVILHSKRRRYPALQPGQTANILRGDEVIGYVGKLHPRVGKLFELKRDAFVFELDAAKALVSAVPVAKTVSKFPAIRRDLAVVVDDNISATNSSNQRLRQHRI